MKQFLTILWLCLATGLFGQSDSTECAANAGPDRTICYTDVMSLLAPFNDTYNTPPNIEWKYLSGPLSASDVHISNTSIYNPTVTNLSGSSTWPLGDYHFQFCVDCKDLNNNHIHDRPCDEVVITVKGGVPQPVITEPDGVQDGYIVTCSETTLTVTEPPIGDTAKVAIYPQDGLVTYTIVGDKVYLKRLETGTFYQGQCDYDITYYITNGGCYQKATVNVTFIFPHDPNHDGIIEGRTNVCPSCNDVVELIGDRPGCGGHGKWEVLSGPGTATFLVEDLSTGYAKIQVSAVGHYVFRYSVRDIDPCQPSDFDLPCDVFSIGGFSLGDDKRLSYCDNTAPAGPYTFTFNQLNNAIYNWTTTHPDVQIDNPHDYMSVVRLLHDIDLGPGPIIIDVTATKYFIDDDCDGPNPPREVDLPSSDPKENLDFIQHLLDDPNICLDNCTDYAQIAFYGAPELKLKSKDIYFLCSDGRESVTLGDYFDVVNDVPYFADITVLQQPPGSSLPVNITEYDLLDLLAINCGKYVFKIDAKSYNYDTGIPIICSSLDTITFYVQTPKPVSAGTNQIKCINEPIKLNGNNPFSDACNGNDLNAIGTWTQVNCSPCTVKFDNPHDPNTQIFLDNVVPPATLDFVWAFASEDSCGLADTTHVYVKPCFVPCPPFHVISECVNDKIILKVLDDQNLIVSPYAYTINWSSLGITGNPVSLTYTGPVNYVVEITLNNSPENNCYTRLAGTVDCATVGCDARVKETCDACGNVTLTLVDLNGNPIPPTPYLHILRWAVYGGGANDPSGVIYQNVNPITIQQNACYSLNYQHYIYPPNLPHYPGTQTSICVFDLPKTCVTKHCEGPCSDFSDFFIAGCGDDTATDLNLSFPENCQSVCASVTPTAVTLGVFYKSTGLPVNPALYNIVWKNGAVGTYANGQILDINTVTITSKSSACCKWVGAYTPSCLCHNSPTSIQCQQPITKYCRPDGSVYYVPGVPQLSWYGVLGATSYVLEVTFGNTGGCCTPPSLPTQYITVTGSPWVIPAGWNCFSVRIKGLNPANPRCPETDWSPAYVYCSERQVCSPVIIVCGCCSGGRSDETMSIPTQVMSEEELQAYLKAYPGTEYVSLQSALTAIGFNGAKTLDCTVYPNPAKDQLVVLFGNGMQGRFKVQISDMLHREWRNTEIESAGENTLNISDLPNGMYLITIWNAKGELRMTQKITVLR